ncbi:MAG: dTMP kinase [Deltaproteobacteria bacterium]|nr:dTMP kinase [Deltaproteobacteria bacterium]
MISHAHDRGLFVALEGIDGSGTTTQARLLVEQLAKAGHPAHLTQEPSSGPVGRLLRDVLRGEWKMPSAGTALLFAADRLHHLNDEILPRLDEGQHVVSDRYLLSSLAYQGLECEHAWVEAINRQAIIPDLTVFLRIHPARAAQRRASRGDAAEIFETDRFQQRVAERYEDLLQPEARSATWDLLQGRWQRSRRSLGDDDARIGEVAVIEGDASPEGIHNSIFALLGALEALRGEERS